jgi:hypothetical protein
VAWNYEANTWTRGALARSAMAPAIAYQTPFMGDADGAVYNHETGWLDNGASRVGTVWLESGALGLGDASRTIDVHQALIASEQGYAKVEATFYGRMAPEGAERTFGPYSARSSGYTDTRVTTRQIRIRLANATDGAFGVGAVKLETTMGTGR